MCGLRVRNIGIRKELVCTFLPMMRVFSLDKGKRVKSLLSYWDDLHDHFINMILYYKTTLNVILWRLLILDEVNKNMETKTFYDIN